MDTGAAALGDEPPVEGIVGFDAHAAPSVGALQQQGVAGADAIVGAAFDEVAVAHAAEDRYDKFVLSVYRKHHWHDVGYMIVWRARWRPAYQYWTRGGPEGSA